MRLLLQDLQPNTMYLVQMRTKYNGLVSDWSRMFELPSWKDEVAPNPVTSLSGVMNEGNLSINWVPPTDNTDGTPADDLKDYVVTIGPVPADPSWPLKTIVVEGNRASFSKEDNAAAFGTYRASLTINVQARDITSNLSAPTTLVIAKPKPSAPTGLTWAAVKNAFSGSWTPPTTNVDGSPFTDADGFDVKIIYNIVNVRTYSVPSTTFDFSFEQNKAAFAGTARTPLGIEVRARDSVGQLSDPVTASAGNPIPVAPVINLAATIGTTSGIVVKWTPSPDDDVVAYNLYVAAGPTGAGTLQATIAGRETTQYTHESVAYTQDHYIYMTAVDDFGSESLQSNRTGALRPVSPFTVDTTAPAQATGVTLTTPAGRTTLQSSAIQLNFTAPVDTDLAGYHVRYARSDDGSTSTTRVWQYLDLPKSITSPYVIEDVVSEKTYVAQIQPYDTMINTPAWPGTEAGPATSTKSNLVATEFQSGISIITGGTLRSADYNAGAGTGWLLQSSGLDIQGGSINARVVKAGTLVSNVNVTYDGTTQPAWSLNLDGNMSINDAQVRGKLVVGNAASVTKSNINIASYNYGASGAQWAIKGDGTIDIKAGGTGANSLQLGNTGIFAYDASNVQRVAITTSGTFAFSTTNGGVQFDDNGLRVISGATTMVDLNRNGNSTFNGTIYANSGAIAGWNITTNNLYSSSISLRPDLAAIYVGSSSNTVGMRAGYGLWAGATEYFNSPTFSVSTTGALYSVSGQIGGFTINGASGLYAGANSSRVQIEPGWGVWTGANSRDSAPWYARNDGYMYARSGQLGGWYLTDTYLYSNYGEGGTLYLSANTGAISGGVITGTVFRTASSGQRIEMRGDSNFGSIDTMRFYGNSNSGWVDLRGWMGTVGGDGFYINGATQIGNVNSAIYQVGKRRATGSSMSWQERVRAGSFSHTTDGFGRIYHGYDTPMDISPTAIQVTLHDPYVYWIAARDQYGFTVQVAYGTGSNVGQTPGAGAIVGGNYYAEAFV